MASKFSDPARGRPAWIGNSSGTRSRRCKAGWKRHGACRDHRGEGAVLRDAQGREYLDGNSSIWTNLHGHRRPEIDEALCAQIGRIGHSSFLGLTNDLAPRLAAELIERLGGAASGRKVFFSDDGSTAMEAGLKMIHQARMQRGESARRVFLSLGAGYHGDTVGAMSLGHSSLFHGIIGG